MPICLSNPGRIAQLILRDADTTSPTYGADLITLDILGPHGGEQGIHLLEGSWDDLFHAPIVQVRDEQGAYEEGTTLGEFPRVNERPVKIQLGTIGRTLREWETIDDLLWQVLGPRWDAYLRVYSQISEPRELKLRWDTPPKPITTIDPGVTQALAWDVPLLACDPYWYGEEIVTSIKRSQMTEVNATTGAPQPGSGVWQGTVLAQNPADVECWPTFNSNELTTSTTVSLPDGLSGRLVELPPLDAGKEFLVYTYPLIQTLWVRDGSQEWANMAASDFESSIPVHTTTPVPIPIRIVGGTADTEIMMVLPQRFTRFMGGDGLVYR